MRDVNPIEGLQDLLERLGAAGAPAEEGVVGFRRAADRGGRVTPHTGGSARGEGFFFTKRSTSRSSFGTIAPGPIARPRGKCLRKGEVIFFLYLLRAPTSGENAYFPVEPLCLS